MWELISEGLQSDNHVALTIFWGSLIYMLYIAGDTIYQVRRDQERKMRESTFEESHEYRRLPRQRDRTPKRR